MTQIVLTDEQTRLLQDASAPIVIVDSHGKKIVEVVTAPSQGETQTDDEWIAEGLRRMEEARRDGFKGSTTQEVLSKLRILAPE